MKQLIGCLLLVMATMGCSQGSSKGTATTNTNSESQQQSSTQGAPQPARLSVSVDGAKAMDYTKEVTAMGPRWPGNAAHKKLEGYLRAALKNDGLVEDSFVANTPEGKLPMRNFIARFPGTKPGVIVVSGHYDTIFNRKDFVGANDAGSSTGLLLALADSLRAEAKGKKSREGYSVWLVWFDGEEAVREWTTDDSVWGSRHLAAKLQQDGTAKNIKALINVDMIGDADLHILFDTNSNGELQKVIYQAARSLGVAEHFYQQTTGMDDDHRPFAQIGVPVADLIDFDYGPNNSYWHKPEDTVDKLSPKSLEIVGNVVLGAVSLLDKQ